MELALLVGSDQDRLLGWGENQVERDPGLPAISNHFLPDEHS